MTKKWAVNWDNGAHACGTFKERYDTEEEAAQAATEWYAQFCIDNDLDPAGDHDAGACPVEVDDEEPRYNKS